MAQTSLPRQPIWIEMSYDRSRTPFRPRKGRIVDLWISADATLWAVIELESRIFSLIPVPRLLKRLVFRSLGASGPLTQVFLKGTATVEVLRTRGLGGSRNGPIGLASLSRLGFADIYPWPKPTWATLHEMFRQWRASDRAPADADP